MVLCNLTTVCGLIRQGGHKNVVISILNKHYFEINNMVKYIKNLYYAESVRIGEEKETVNETKREKSGNEVFEEQQNDDIGDQVEEPHSHDGSQQLQKIKTTQDTRKIEEITEKMMEIQETMASFSACIYEQEMKTSESKLNSP